ncbi:MAG: glutathione S-transferase family protein [Candidatus Polarisedimenticolia bacterium]
MMLTLYQFEGSPYCWKVRIVLAEKGIPWAPIVPQNRDQNPEFRRLTAVGKVPVLVLEDGTSVYESTIINEYLEERYPENPLLPAGPALRARARMVEETADQYLGPALRSMLLARARMEGGRWVRRPDPSPSQEAEGLRAATPYLDHLNRLVQGREHFLDRFSLADVGLIPVLGRTGRAVGLPLSERWPGLDAWLTRCLARPSVSSTTPAPLVIHS